MAAGPKSTSHRRLLLLAACAVCKEQGFEGASQTALESLSELFQCYLTELSILCHEFSELSHRTVPDLTDVKNALVELGSDINSVKNYALNPMKEKLKPVEVGKVPSDHKQFHSGLSRILRPSYIPPHLPDFPEVHAFVKTPTLREPVNEYRTVRQKVAAQRSETEGSLMKFLSRTRPAAVTIYDRLDPQLFPLAEVEKDGFPYLRALLPAENETVDFDDTNLDEKLDRLESGEEVGNTVDGGDQPLSTPDILSPDRMQDNPFFKPAKKMKISRK